MPHDKELDSQNGGAKKICVSLKKGEDQHERWKSMSSKLHFPSLSAMIVHFVEKGIEKMERDDLELPGLRSSIDRTCQEVEMVRKIVDTIDTRLKSQNGDSEMRDAARAVLELLEEEGDITVTEIHGELDYEPEVIDSALILLDDLGLGGFKQKNLNRGDNND